MNDTTTLQPGAQTTHPAGPLMNRLIALLTPMFIDDAGGDIAYARSAAIQTINDFRARNRADLIAIAQIIAFGIAALGSLSLSMADDISLSRLLRLRTNANACNRSAEQNRRVLNKPVPADPGPYQAAADPAPSTPPPKQYRPAEAPEPSHSPTLAAYEALPDEIFLSAAAEQQMAAESEARLQDPKQPRPHQAGQKAAPTASQDKRHKQMWAIAMAKEASDITDAIPNLPISEQQAAILQAITLNKIAQNLTHEDTPPLTPDNLAGLTPPNLARDQPPL
jgi:hypothetical protein